MLSSGRFPTIALAFYFLCCSVRSVYLFPNVFPKIRQVPLASDPGEPLFLTPLIDDGNITEAVQRARVGPLPGDQGIISYSGFLTVNQIYNSNLFFWFFPAEENSATAPVVLWLQGGPGVSSLYGLFAENGPFTVDDTMTLKRREYPWTANHSILYIDNPVGTGFSFTKDVEGYATNQTSVGNDLYIALIQFFTLFPEFKNNDFFITGESYAGKYVPAIGFTIHTRNPTASLKINLKGIAIGNGLIDPVNQLNYADYLYQIGLIDSNVRERMRILQNTCIQQINQQNYTGATKVHSELLNEIMNAIRLPDLFNYLNKSIPLHQFDSFLQQSNIKLQIHVGNQNFNSLNHTVYTKLQDDRFRSVKHWLEILLDSYRVIIYNGQLDIIVAYPLTDNFVQTLQWSGTDVFRNAKRTYWKVGNNLAGYVKTAGKFTEILVRNAGHMVPSDQPLFAIDLLNRLTSDISFS